MSVKYMRKFECDKSLSKGIKWLNRNGFYTAGCCSGIREEHPNNERNRMYLEFEGLKHSKKYQVILIGRDKGFTIKKKNKTVRLESEANNKLEIFEGFVKDLKRNKNSLDLRTMGISNWCKDVKEKTNRNLYSIQFYDYDGKEWNNKILKRIMEIFPLDCLMYETKHGIHFISFALRYGLKYTKTKAIETSKALGNQDYWTEAKDLTLRVSAKWKRTFFNSHKIISKKPKFKGLIKSPEDYIISKKHLEFYRKYMNLPKWVYDLYNSCDKRDYKIKVYHYKTRD